LVFWEEAQSPGIRQTASYLTHTKAPSPSTHKLIPPKSDKFPKAGSLEVGLGLVLSIRSHANLVNNNSLSRAASNLDIDRLLAKTGRVLKEVVLLALSLTPGLAAVGRNLDALDGLVGVDNLDGEPVGGGTGLVVENERSGDAALNELVRGLDDAVCAADGLEGIGEEIEMAGVTLGALVDDLDKVSRCG